MKPQIEIIVAPDGTSKVETQGFQGSGCRVASQFMEQALGRRLFEQLKPAFYQQEVYQQHRHTGTSS